MMKPTVYIETTIPCYYFDQRSSLQFQITRTRQWWDEERLDYELLTSEAVLRELDDPRNPNRENCLHLLETLPSVRITPEVGRIVEVYTARGIMPRSRSLDAVHLALASYYKVDFLLTWNCRHLANPNKFTAIRQVNGALGLFGPILTTPYDLQRISEED